MILVSFVVRVVGLFFFSSRRRHTRCALVTGVQTLCSSDLNAAFAVAWRLHQQIGDRSATTYVDHVAPNRIPVLGNTATHPFPCAINEYLAQLRHRRKVAFIDATLDPDPFAFLGRDRKSTRLNSSH